MICSHCGREIREEDAEFCPYCAKPLKPQKKRSGFPIASGVLTIIASCISIILGILGTTAFIATYGQRYYGMVPFGYSIMGFLCFVAFALGLTSGIFTLKRRRFGLSIAGVSIVLASGIATVIAIGAQGFFAITAALLFGLPVVILAILGIVFIAISKTEFA